MLFSVPYFLGAIMMWFGGITMGILWERGRSISYISKLFHSENRPLVFVCYGGGLVIGALGILLGVLLGGILGILVVDPSSAEAGSQVVIAATLVSLFAEFLLLCLWGNAFNRKVFLLPPP